MSNPSKDNSRSIILLETLAAGPLKVGPTPPRPGLMGAFERYGKRLLKHPLFPWVGRWTMIGFLIALTYAAFFGPRDPRLNFATVMSWVVWWPLLAISYLVIGRVWCAVCPMGALSDIVHRKIGLNLKAPELFKKRWLVAVLLESGDHTEMIGGADMSGDHATMMGAPANRGIFGGYTGAVGLVMILAFVGMVGSLLYALFCEKPGQPQPAACWNCERLVETDWKTCPYCGAVLAAQATGP